LRRIARETSFQVLFQLDMGNADKDLTVQLLSEEKGLGKADRTYLEETLRLFLEHRDEIDSALTRYLKKGWSMDRLGSAERAVLRLAALEILYMDDIPPQVSINEAIELTKAFGDDEAAPLVNGVLDRVAHGMDGTPEPVQDE